MNATALPISIVQGENKKSPLQSSCVYCLMLAAHLDYTNSTLQSKIEEKNKRKKKGGQ